MFCIFELRAIESIWTSVNFAFLAHVELIKLCDAPESNNMIIGRSLRKNVPTSTSSSVEICSTWCSWRG
jgi:hypothetical protein